MQDNAQLNDVGASPSEAYSSEQNQTGPTKPAAAGLSLRDLKAWHRSTVQAESQWRDRAEEDSRFMAGDHWTDEEKKVLRDRKQAPIVFNRIARDVLIQVGRQVQRALQPTCKPRGHADDDMASAITDVLRYVMDANGWTYEQTQAVMDQVTGPRGWLFCGYQNDDLNAEPIRLRHVPWREMRLDPLSRRADMSDAKFVFRERWADFRDVVQQYGKRDELQGMVNQGADNSFEGPHREYYTGDAYANAKENGDGPAVNYVSGDRKRLRLVECWFRQNKEAWALKWPDGRVVILGDDLSGASAAKVFDPSAQLVRGIHPCVYYVIFCGDVVLAQGKSPYAHNRFPYVCIHGFRSNTDKGTDTIVPGEPYGLIRNAKDPQRVINHTQSKVRHILNTRQVVMTKGVADRDEVEQALSDPGGIIELIEDGRFEAVDQLNQASALLNLIPLAEDQLQSGTGVNEASRGEGPEASGRALFARQQQSETTNALLVDNQRLAIKQVGEMVLSMVQQSYTQEKVIRITENNGDRVVAVNVADPVRAQMLQTQGVQVKGNLDQDIYDVIVDEAPAGQERLQADQELLMSVAQQLGPQALLAVSDLLVENTDLRNKRELMERLSKIQQQALGGGGPSPQQQQAMAQQHEAMMAQTQAKTHKDQAQAAKAMAEAQRTASETMAQQAMGGMYQ